VHERLVREIDDACRREAHQDHALHRADERALVTEVGSDADDAARLEAITGLRVMADSPERAACTRALGASLGGQAAGGSNVSDAWRRYKLACVLMR
jgi:hypothetical protein